MGNLRLGAFLADFGCTSVDEMIRIPKVAPGGLHFLNFLGLNILSSFPCGLSSLVSLSACLPRLVVAGAGSRG